MILMETRLFPIGFSFVREARLCFQETKDDPAKKDTPEIKENKDKTKTPEGGDDKTDTTKKPEVKDEKGVAKAAHERTDVKSTVTIALPPEAKAKDLSEEMKKLEKDALEKTLGTKKDTEKFESPAPGSVKNAGGPGKPAAGSAKGAETAKPTSKDLELPPDLKKALDDAAKLPDRISKGIQQMDSQLPQLLGRAINLSSDRTLSPEHRTYARVALIALAILAIHQIVRNARIIPAAKNLTDKPSGENADGDKKNPDEKGKETDVSTKARRERLTKEAGGPAGIEKLAATKRDERAKQTKILEDEIGTNSKEIDDRTKTNSKRRTDVDGLQKEVRDSTDESIQKNLNNQIKSLDDQIANDEKRISDLQSLNKKLNTQIINTNPELQADIKMLDQMRKDHQERIRQTGEAQKTLKSVEAALRAGGNADTADLIHGITIDGDNIRISDAARPILQKMLRDQGQPAAEFSAGGVLLNAEIFDQVLKTMQQRMASPEKKNEKPKDVKKP